MSTLMVEFWLLVVMAFSLIALAIATVLIYSPYWQIRDKPFRVGFLLLCLGLGVQTFRSLHFLQFNSYPVDFYFPTWIVKDAGFCLIVYSEFKKSQK
jgi:nitric oxide reductase large subunit